MAVVSSVPVEGAPKPNQKTSEITGSKGEIVEETPPGEVEDKIYVAVGKDLKESRSTLLWALRNSGGRQICILHVHQPAEKIPIMGTKFRISQLDPLQVAAYHELERQKMHQLLNKYNQICQKAGVRAERQPTEMASIEKGIVEFILEHNVTRLVMGAAADKQFSKRMVDLKSKKAIYVRLHAAASCEIQFICKGNVIFTRKGRLDRLGVSISSSSLLPTTESDSARSSLRLESDTRLSVSSLPNCNVESTPASRLTAGRASNECSGISQRSSNNSIYSSCSSELMDDSGPITHAITESGEIKPNYSAVPGLEDDIHHPRLSNVLERIMNDELVHAMAEADNLKRDVFEESIRHKRAEKHATEAECRMLETESDSGDREKVPFVEVDPSGRYGRYSELLGAGSVKKVYRAFDQDEWIEVAWNQVKLSNFCHDQSMIKRLFSEVKLLTTLKNNNIITLFHEWLDTERNTLNFITELCTSGNLREYRQRHKQVSLQAIKKWSLQILKGLDYLHRHEPCIIHRDLNCSNIFINGNIGQVKIGDLGLAAIVGKSHSAHSILGTPEFMAPELYDEDYTELVDIYSFGMCLLEMVTLEVPYSECGNVAGIYRKVTSGVRPKAMNKVKDPEVKAFIEKCLARPRARPSAAQLLKDPFFDGVFDDVEI